MIGFILIAGGLLAIAYGLALEYSKKTPEEKEESPAIDEPKESPPLPTRSTDKEEIEEPEG